MTEKQITDLKAKLHEVDLLLCDIAQNEKDKEIQDFLYDLSQKHFSQLQHSFSKLLIQKRREQTEAEAK